MNIATAGALAYAVLALTGPWKWLALVAGAAIGAAALVFALKDRLSVNVRCVTSPADDDPERSCRLLCYGEARELADVERVSPDFFEPVIFSAPRMRKSLADGLLWLVVPVVLAAKVLYPGIANYLLVLVLFSSLSGTHLLLGMARSYYRIVPGRLDILRCGVLRAQPLSCTSVSLRDTRVTCRFDEAYLELEPIAVTADTTGMAQGDRDDATSMRIDLSTVDRPHAFVAAIFRGAMSDLRAPKLPADELLG